MSSKVGAHGTGARIPTVDDQVRPMLCFENPRLGSQLLSDPANDVTAAAERSVRPGKCAVLRPMCSRVCGTSTVSRLCAPWQVVEMTLVTPAEGTLTVTAESDPEVFHVARVRTCARIVDVSNSRLDPVLNA